MSEEAYLWLRLFLAFSVGVMFGFVMLALIVTAKGSDNDYD